MVPANMNGKFVIRFCVCAQNAIEEDIEIAWKIIQENYAVLFETVQFASLLPMSSLLPLQVILIYSKYMSLIEA